MASPHVAGAAALLLQRHPEVDGGAGQVGARLDRQPGPGARPRGAADPRGRRDDLAAARRPAARVRRADRASRSGCCAAATVDSRRVRLTDAGGGAGVWTLSVRKVASVRGAVVSASAGGGRSREADSARTTPARRAPATRRGFVVLTRGGDDAADPVLVPRRASRGSAASRPTLLRRPGRLPRRHARPAGPSSARTAIPSEPVGARRAAATARPGAGLPLRAPRPGRERGRVVISRAPASHVSPRLVRAGDEDRWPATRRCRCGSTRTSRLLRGSSPVVGVVPPGARRLRPRLRHRQPAAAGRFTFRFWVERHGARRRSGC